MNEDLLARFSPSAQRALRLLAASADDAVHFHNRLTVIHAGLKIGAEVVEMAIREKPDDPANSAKAIIAQTVLAQATALECTMKILKDLHPGEIGQTNRTRPPKAGEPPKPENRIRPLELD